MQNISLFIGWLIYLNYKLNNLLLINQINKLFLWHETPETIIINYDIIGSRNQHRLTRIFNKLNHLIDTGIDIIQIDNDENISLVNCKNGYNNSLVIAYLYDFTKAKSLHF